MPSKVLSAVVVGINCEFVEVEADVARGLGNFIIVGLPDTAVQESRERVRSAIRNSNLEFPQTRVTVNLAPADIKKEGPVYDLPIALGVLLAQGKNKLKNFDPARSVFMGELSLDGTVRPISGVLAAAIMCQEKKCRYLFVPQDNAAEAALINGVEIIPVNNINQLIEHLAGIKLIKPFVLNKNQLNESGNYPMDMAHIRGQEQAKRALEIAAAGAHNIMMSGPPGSGKTLLARTFPSILPPMSLAEAIDVTKVYSISRRLSKNEPIVKNRPFRSPHHTSSAIALIGGGSNPKPGEISLAHRGVLFLDELPEFSRLVLESLRQPLEDGFVTVARANASVCFPARFILVAAQNPCPCGHLNDADKNCACSPAQVFKYQQRLSGPLLDRIDLHLEVPKVKVDKLAEANEAESSANIRARVAKARELQKERFSGTSIFTNAEMDAATVKKACALDEDSATFAKNAISRFNLSARSYFKVLKIARTIADLGGTRVIEVSHLAEAFSYRLKN